MNFRSHSPPSVARHSAASKDSRGSRGYLLIEVLMYIAVLALVMELAFSSFYRCLETTRDLHRESEDILRALRVGEAWRADIRAASAPPQLIREGKVTFFEIPAADGLVVYVFGDGPVWRKRGDAPPQELFPRVRGSSMTADQTFGITSWRWELELWSKKKQMRLHPLFTFQAVPGTRRLP